MIVGELCSRADGQRTTYRIVTHDDVLYSITQDPRVPWLVYLCPHCCAYAGMVRGMDTVYFRAAMECCLRSQGWEETSNVYGTDGGERVLRCAWCANIDLARYWALRDDHQAQHHSVKAEIFQHLVRGMGVMGTGGPIDFNPPKPERAPPGARGYSASRPLDFDNLPQVAPAKGKQGNHPLRRKDNNVPGMFKGTMW